ncbi:hypothetical protein [Guptibacillus spartinae]|uniref:hypothetical protein n=1 Tax=Guptibacillus spartinae TaxID=3025679 RepID=UPI00235EDE9E|nr:hypothetical protein [Pseudalkalibacillus spartinae]
MLTRTHYKERRPMDQRLINWSVEQTKEQDYQDSNLAIVECTCTNSDGDELQTVKTLEMSPEHDSWEEWMDELKKDRFEIIQCPSCKVWTIDDNQ